MVGWISGFLEKRPTGRAGFAAGAGLCLVVF